MNSGYGNREVNGNDENGNGDTNDLQFFMVEMKTNFYSWKEVQGEIIIPNNHLCTYGFLLNINNKL